MRNFHVLVDAVQKNCLITDARHARSMTMCMYLLEMQQYYRWENGIPYSRSLPKNDLGSWLVERERLWGELEEQPYTALPLGEDIAPFDSAAVNRRIIPEGFVYSAGIGRFGKPHFFLGKLATVEQRGDYTILISDCEYARDLTTPPAALQDKTIFLRRDAVRRMLWEKYEEWLWKKRGNSALFGNFNSDPEAALEAMAEKECETVILHELGEGMAGELLGMGWENMLANSPSVVTEIVLRALRDLLADCLSTLPALIQREDAESLHFYFANLAGMRLEMFPMAVRAYRLWMSNDDIRPLADAAAEGRKHWLETCRQLLDAFESHGESLLLDDGTQFQL